MITPLGTKVAVRREAVRRESGSIISPDLYDEPSQIGEVVSLGTGKPKHQFTVKPGDKVLLPDMAARGEYAVADDLLMIISEENLLGILEEAK